MKYFLALLAALTCLLVFGLILETEYSFVLKIVFTLITFILAYKWEYSVLNKNFESDYKFRSQKKTIEVFDIINAIFWTIYVLFLSNYEERLTYLIFAFWAFPIIEFIMLFIYKSKKPYTLFIKDNELILNRRWTIKRNLNDLNQIQYNTFSKNLKLDFDSKTEISIKSTEYNIEDLQKLLEIMIEKSKNDVFIPHNFEFKL